MNKKIKIFLFFGGLLWIVGTLFIFNKYAYNINEFNAKFRVLVTSGKLSHRNFDENGFAISTSPRIGDFISPFYVVHYGLIYSEELKDKISSDKLKQFHWREDPSLEYWNVPPVGDNINYEEYFYNMAEWLVDNIQYFSGGYHYVYDFDWPYKGYPDGGLKAGWWSGLTDGYAIVLLLRAHEYFEDERFFDTATLLYNSLLKDIQEGGSVNYIDGNIWIEEYIDPRFSGSDMSYVLNGMIYATYGIISYENKNNKQLYSEGLIQSITSSLSKFDLSGWSSYDLIGNSANIKYHNIHYSLLQDLRDREYNIDHDVLRSWEKGYNNPGLYFILKGPISMAYYHFLATFIFVIFFPIFTYLTTKLARKYAK